MWGEEILQEKKMTSLVVVVQNFENKKLCNVEIFICLSSKKKNLQIYPEMMILEYV